MPTWTQLHFYAGHGNSIIDPGVKELMSGSYQVKETIEPGKMVTNYSLSKYQGKHGNANETYTSLSADVARNAGHLNYIAEQAAMGRVHNYRNFNFRFHVLTIRNRRLQGDPGLSDVLKALDQHDRRYENIHCSFCRSAMYGSSGTETAKKYGT